MVTACAMFMQSISFSLVSYVSRLRQVDCSIDRLMSGEQVRNGTIPCFVPGRRSLDVITPMADLRLVVMYAVLIVKESCRVLTPPLDLMAYPFLDINLAKGLHSVTNAILYWFVSMPIVTIQRCMAVSTGDPPPFPAGHWMRFLMCTPDTTPGFNYLIAGVRRFGQLVDNWGNAVWLVLLGALGLPTPTCAPIPLTNRSVVESTLFGGNETRIVGLTSGAYGITDGLSVQYTFFMGRITQVFAPYAWTGVGVNIKHGIAAVMYDVGDDSIDANSGQATMSMMGCRCVDVLDPLGYQFADGKMSRMEIECSILRYDPGVVGADQEVMDAASPHFVPLAFAVPAAALYMRCATTKITVDSARFPLWRQGGYSEVGKGVNYDDPMDSEFTHTDGVDGPDEIDAVVWVVPACNADSIDPACQSAMVDAGCFPYCLAARRRATRNNGLTLYSANDWVNKVQLMDHDCSATLKAGTASDVVAYQFEGGASSGSVNSASSGSVNSASSGSVNSASSGSVNSASSGSVNSASSVNSSYKGLVSNGIDLLNGQLFLSESWDPRTNDCTYNPSSTSRVDRGTLITAGSTMERFKSVLLPGQPFAVAGETALTIVPPGPGHSGYAIRVQRLFGQQGIGFVSLVTVNSELPANAPCITMQDCGNADKASNLNRGIATVPYSVFSDPSTHNPAAMTKWGVVYAANPSYAMFSQLFRYCQEGDTALQFQLLSSFGPIRLWRVDAFAYDDPGGVRAVKTGSFVEIPDGFQSDQHDDFCGRVFNVRVSSIEYLNDQNVAVQVLRANARSFDPNIPPSDEGKRRTGPNGEPLLTYRTYFLNPGNMQLRVDLMWEEENAASELGQGLLCPSQRRMPDFGSMAAEVVAAGLHAVRMFCEMMLSGPAVFTPGSYSRIQTMNMPTNYGHSFLLSQGMGWLNFDPFFESLRRAHQHFFNSFTKLGSLFDQAPYVNQFMNGFALYNQDYTPLVTKNMKTYLGEAQRAAGTVDGQITSMVQSVAGKQPAVFTGFVASAGVLNMAQYTCRMWKTLVVSTLLPALDSVFSDGDSKLLVNGLWQVVYASQADYKTLILASELRSCVGLQLMLGQSNPFGRLAGTVCESSVMFKLGAIDTGMAIFVDLPMLACLCTDSQQKDYKQWAMDHCYESAPTHFKGVVLSIIQGSHDLSTMCETASLRVQGRIRDSMNPFLASSYRASATLADTVDFMRFAWDRDAGSCRDYAGDASVTAILPDPIEFWRICAWTQSCKAKCSGSITTFEAAKTSYGVTIRDVRMVTSQATVESSLFSDHDIISSRSLAPFDILDMAEMGDCTYTCNVDGVRLEDRCVAILGIEYGVTGATTDGSVLDGMTGSIAVYEYCVPLRLDATVWLARKWRVLDSHKWVSGMLQIKLFHQGAVHCAKFSGAFCSVAVLGVESVSLYREDGREYRLETYSPVSGRNTRLTDVHRITTLGNDMLLIYGRGPTKGAGSVKMDRSLCVDTRKYTRSDRSRNEWTSFDVSACAQNVLDNTRLDIAVCILDKYGWCSSMLLIPTRDEAMVMRCEFETDTALPAQIPPPFNQKTQATGVLRGRLVKRGDCEQFPLSKGAVRQAGLYNTITAPLMGTFSTTDVQRRSSIVVSTSISSVGLRLLHAFKEFDIFVANHPKKHVNWLAVMRIDTRASVFLITGSARVQVDVSVQHGCRIDDCTGCTIRSVQTLCYAAQQCTVANCIGTTVNLNKPLCSIGKLLADSAEHFLLQWRAGWNLLSIMLIQTISVASTGRAPSNSATSASDEMFTSQICLQKDTIYDIAGAVTSFLNSNIGMVDNLMQSSGNVGAFFQAPKIFEVGDFVSSEYREAQRTMTLAAVTRFLGNVGLALVYPSLAMRKMLMCQTNDIVSIFNVRDMQLTITSPEYEDAFSVVTGKCLTDFESDNVNDQSAVGVNAALDSIAAWLGTVPFANYKHMLDGGLGYVMGLIRGIQDMVQVSDVQHCKLRDAAVSQQGQCACGDDPVRIPEVHGTQSVQKLAFWCTGFLRMETAFGTPLYVFNPYTYEELVRAAYGTDVFLDCLGKEQSGSCADKKPPLLNAQFQVPLLQKQGAQLLAVLTRCNANYQAMQWDAGATMLYKDPELLPPYLKALKGDITVGHDTVMASPDVTLTRCMLNVIENEQSNDGCLQQYLASASVGVRREDYFVYESFDQVTRINTERIAACIVFSGPSKLPVAGEVFRRCTHPDSVVNREASLPCQLGGYVWSSRSRNAVPVANMHAVIITDEVAKATHADNSYSQISESVLAAIHVVNTTWRPEVLEVALFTAEGDFLHQAFDCVLLGPYGRADLSPRDLGGQLPALEYYRDRERGATRDFVLPCTGDELDGDFHPPFTCGSKVRRSIIKSFVRDGIGDAGAINELAKTAIALEIQTMLHQARVVFQNPTKLSCACVNPVPVAFGPQCCADSLGKYFEAGAGEASVPEKLRTLAGEEKAVVLARLVPANVRDFKFTTITNTDVASALVDVAFGYLQTDVWKNRSVSTSHGVDPLAYVLSDQQREIAVREGLYQTTEPLTTYGLADAFEQTTTASALEVCMGAVSQVMFTLPVGDHTTGAPTTLSSMDVWDPTQTAPEGHFTALEAWVRRLVADARDVSPLYWSHRLKHVASDSRVCVALFSDAGTDAETPPASASSASFVTLAASVRPGPSMKGVYESFVTKGDDILMTFPPPDGVRGDETIFRESNSSVWALGQVVRTCFCGWDSAQDAAGRVWCMIPPTVCTRNTQWSERVVRICTLQSGMYWNHWEKSEDGRAVGLEMQALVQTFDRIECPWNMADAAAWGLLDEDSFVSHWLLQKPDTDATRFTRREATRFTSKHLLYEGRGGVRYMNAEDVLKRGRDSALLLFNPLEVASTVAQHHCEARVKARAAVENSFADHFRDVLFPVVQGVPENRGTAFCLRYVVELATLVAMQHVLSPEEIGVVKQLEVVATWSRKCHTQTKLLGFCALRNVFAAHRIKKVQNNGLLQNHPDCTSITFSGSLPGTDSFVVVGASCVAVYHRKATDTAPAVLRILDPCRVVHVCHGSNNRNNSVPSETVTISAVGFIEDNMAGVAVLDPSSFLSNHSRTLSLKWSSPDDPHWKTVQQARDRYAEKHEQDAHDSSAVGLHIENLWQRYVRPAPPVADPAPPVADPAPPVADQSHPHPLSADQSHVPWHRASGPRTEDEGASCGGVSDWWPEAWEHPVGFHVTTPCTSPLTPGADQHAANEHTVDYRTFSNQFEYDAAGHAMRYQHTKHRDETLMMNHAGAAGMCRLNTFAQTLREQNNMRVCTRMRKNTYVDYAVPLLFENRDSVVWTDAACSTSPLHVPWDPNGTQHARLRSSALLPSWPADGTTVWPKDSPMLDLGLPTDAHADSWTLGGGGCGMPPLYKCVSDADCSMHTLGSITDVTFTCMNGVCVVTKTAGASATDGWANADNYVQCTEHSHCTADLLCSGEGRCVLPVVEIVNEFQGGAVDLSWHAKSCDGASMDTVDMYGKSPWGRITGLFEAHGLCSYRNWFEYRSVFAKQCPNEAVYNDLCTLSESVQWTDTTREEDVDGVNIFASQEVLYQEAHRCDRDFQHYNDHVLCRPRISDSLERISDSLERISPTALVNKHGNPVTARYSSLYQTYYRDGPGHRVKIARMEYMDNPQAGFLSSGLPLNDLKLQACVDIPQCSLPNYDIQGHAIAERLVYKSNTRGNGLSFPYLGSRTVQKRCLVDFAVVPLAHLVYVYFNLLATSNSNSASDSTTTEKFKSACILKVPSTTWVSAFKTIMLEGYDATRQGRATVRAMLTTVINDLFLTDFDTIDEYKTRLECARIVTESLATGSLTGTPRTRQSYDVVVKDDTDTDTHVTKTVWSNSVINHFAEYSMVEVAPMWWVKCHLLSGIKVSATDSVECPAWERWLQMEVASKEGADEAVSKVTFKAFLQQTAKSLRPMDELRWAARSRVVQMGNISLYDVYSRLNAGNPTVPLQPTCSNRRTFRNACNETLYQDMVHSTYSTGRENALAAYILANQADFNGFMCTNKEQCVPSSGTEKPTKSDGLDIIDIVRLWMFESASGFGGGLVQAFTDPVLLNAKVPQWGDPEIELFSQPWLDIDRTSDIDTNGYLSKSIQDTFPGIADDRCEIWSYNLLGFSPNGTKSPCIYQGVGQSVHDSINIDAPRWDNSPALVTLWHGTSYHSTTSNHAETIPVCASTAPNGKKRAAFLDQRCYVADESVPTRTPSSDGFKCTEESIAIGCASATATIPNPYPNRVCYETGNSCFNKEKTTAFSTTANYHWKQARLPVGVRLITYGYSPDPDVIIGRNPLYSGTHEKLFWGNKFYNRGDAQTRAKEWVDNDQPIVTAIPGTAPNTGRRLLANNADRVEDSERAYDDYFAEYSAAKDKPRLWETEHDCKAGWVQNIDAERMQATNTLSGVRVWDADGYASWDTETWQASDDTDGYPCADYEASDGRDGRDCCKCRPGDIEYYHNWGIRMIRGGDLWMVNGCYRCDRGKTPHPTDRTKCVAKTGQSDLDAAAAAATLLPSACPVPEMQWPPRMTWYTDEKYTPGYGEKDTCAYCKDDKNGCSYHRVLASYTGAKKYPPWYNCNIPDSMSEMDASIPYKDRTFPRSITKILQDHDSTPSEFKRDYTTHKESYLDYSEGPVHFGQHRKSGSPSQVTEVSLPLDYTSLSLELMDGFSCGLQGCAGVPTEVHPGYYFCSECTRTAPNREYCRGVHGCRVQGVSKVQASVDFQAGEWQTMRIDELQSSLQGTQNGLSIFDTVQLLVHLTMARYRQMFLKNATELRDMFDTDAFSMRARASDIQYTPTASMQHPPDWDFALYSPERALRWQDRTGMKKIDEKNREYLDIQACTEPSLNTAQVAYGQCSNNQQIVALRNRANAAYNTTGPLVLPVGHSLLLHVSASHLMSSSGGVLLSWAQNERVLREKHFEYIMDLDNTCKETDIWDAVCRVNTDGMIELFNPWTAGGFSAVAGCDISRSDANVDSIDTRCVNSVECKTQTDASAFYHDQPGCLAIDGDWSPKRIVRPAVRSNVCFLKPTAVGGACTHPQGVLGGGAAHGAVGLPHASLYSFAVSPNADTREQGGLFVQPHRELFRTLAFTASDVGIDKNFLHLNDADIGGHRMHFVVSVEGVLRLYDIVLAGGHGNVATDLTVSDRLKVLKRTVTDGTALKRWLTWDIEAEHRDAIEQEPDVPGDDSPLHWACPMKQRLFLSGQAGSHFRPSLPSQRRAAVLFARHNGQHGGSQKRSSTVQAPRMANTFVYAPKLKTSNGFCFCASIEDCQMPIGTADACGLRHSFEMLRSNARGWHTSKVARGQSQAVCTDQLDWPYTGGALRDGSFIGAADAAASAADAAAPAADAAASAADAAASDGSAGSRKAEAPEAGSSHTASECNLLDRIHDFQYMYQKHTPVANSEHDHRNTQVAGGDCYTGTAKRTQQTHAGAATRGYSWNPAERRSCQGRCAAPPVFTAGKDDMGIPVETSFGVLYRESAERAIAGNLRERLHSSLCGAFGGPSNKANGTCEALERVFNVSSWVPERFWDSFVKDVDTLFLHKPFHTLVPPEKSTKAPDGAPVPPKSARVLLAEASETLEMHIPAEEVTMWAVPWVFCSRAEPECSVQCDTDTRNNCNRRCARPENSTCTQAIDRETWLDPESRVSACKASLDKASQDGNVEAVTPMNICDMDSVMNQFCTVLAAARNRIFDANCRAAGLCHEERFFYVPSIYSAANQEFVKATVETFYLAENTDSCPIADTTSQSVQDSNAISVQECPASQLQIVYELLRNLRVVVDRLMRIAYFAGMICINLLRFIFMGSAADSVDPNAVASENPHAWGQVIKYWELLMREMGAMWMALGDLIFEFIMESGMGQALQQMLDDICTTVQWVFDEMWIKFFCVTLFDMGNWMVSFEFLGKPLEVLGLAILEFHTQNCNNETMACSGLQLPMEDLEPETGLPVATRCWSTYSTFLGDQSSLSCSAADTCMGRDVSTLFGPIDASSQTAGLAACDSCPRTTLSAARYGCDIVTKTCKCGVPLLLRTTCITNDECRFSGSTCDIVDNFFERDSFGSIACEECSTNRICLVSPGDSVGHCTCATREVGYTTCADNARGELVFTPPFSMCMVALGSAARNELKTSALYRIEGKKLATARCDMLDASQRFCISVEMGPSMAPTYAVGLDNLFSRRLLQIADANNPVSAFYRFVIPPEVYERALHSDWSTVKTLACRHVPHLLLVDEKATRTPKLLSISDEELLRACVRWRAIGIEIVHLTNVSSLIPDTFLVGPEDFATDVVAHPVRMYTVLQRPWIWVRALLHSTYMAPVRVLLRDAHKWWLHANIEAFASSNALATMQAAARAAVAAPGDDSIDTNTTNTNTTSTNTTSLLDDFSRGMSRHLTASMWTYIFNFNPVRSPSRTGHRTGQTTTVFAAVNQTNRLQAQQRRQRRYETALGHSILHTHTARSHWLQKTDDTVSSEKPYTKKKLPKKVMTFKTSSATMQPSLASSPSPSPLPVMHSNPSRSLLGLVDDSFVSRMNAVQRYSEDVALGDGVVQILPEAAAKEFFRGDFSWPITYVYWDPDNSCNLATNTYTAIEKATSLLHVAFDEEKNPPRPQVSYSPLLFFSNTWQFLNKQGESRNQLKQQQQAQEQQQQQQPPIKNSTFAQYIEKDAAWYVSMPVVLLQARTGIKETPFVGLAFELATTVTKVLKCDVEAIMFCSSHHYSVFTSAFIAIISLSILGSVLSFTGIPVVSTLISLIGFGYVTLFISFSYAPSCAPLVPVCFFETMVSDVVYWLPKKIVLPNSILNCVHDQTISVPPSSCIVSCEKEPFYFRDWTSNVAWMLCDYFPVECTQVQNYLSDNVNQISTVIGSTASNIERALYRSRIVLASGDTNIIEGFHFCNLTSLYQVIPLAVIVFFVATALPLAIALGLKIVIGFVRTAMSAFILSHL
ncbi:hypothetical protein T484DRAFT_3629597 [Baffinella frigidus]|nr:hypothetical protein T484DRAFT_3629597 [Cryptophyta sp. CCMP2293]